MAQVEGLIHMGQLVICLGSQASRIGAKVKGIIDSEFKGAPATDFIAIDTDVLDALEHIPRDELHRIYLRKPGWEKISTAGRWLPEEILASIKEPTGFGKNRIGAPVLLSSDYAEVLRDRISRLIDAKFKEGIPALGVTFIVCAGGGTGSGLLPYMIDLITQVFKDTIRGKPTITVFAILPEEGEDKECLVNAYALLKEIAFMHAKGKAPNYVILLQRKIGAIVKDEELPRLIANFLIDFPYIYPIVYQGKLIDRGDMAAFEIKNPFTILGVHIVRFPIDELNWFYSTEDLLQDKKREFSSLKLRGESEGKSFEELKNEIKELRRKRESTIKEDEKAELERQISELESLIDEFPVAELFKKREDLVNKLMNIENTLDRKEKWLKLSGYGSKVEQIRDRIKDLRTKRDESIDILLEAVNKLKESFQESLKRVSEEITDLEHVKEEALRYLQDPPSYRHDEIIRLSKEDIERLREKKNILKAHELSFKEIMEILGRKNEYESKTYEVPDEFAMYNLFVSYDTERGEKQRQQMLQNLPTAEIRDRVKVQLTQSRARLFVCSNERNFEEKPLIFKSETFQRTWWVDSASFGNGPIRLPGSLRKFVFTKYVLIGGLSLLPPTMSSLKNISFFPILDMLHDEYSKYCTRGEENLLRRHSYLYPVSIKFEEHFRNLGQEIPVWTYKTNPQENALQLTKFWSNYSIAGLKGMEFMVEFWLINLQMRLIEEQELNETIGTLEESLPQPGILKTYSKETIRSFRETLIIVSSNLNKILDHLQRVTSKDSDLSQLVEEFPSVLSTLDSIKSTSSGAVDKKTWSTFKEDVEKCEYLIKGLLEITIPTARERIGSIGKMLESEDYMKFVDQASWEGITIWEKRLLSEVSDEGSNIKAIIPDLRRNLERYEKQLDNIRSNLRKIREYLPPE